MYNKQRAVDNNQQQMINNILENLGLNSKESQVYLVLLELGAQPVSIVAKKSKINRTTCYAVLEELTKKNLVFHYNKAKIKVFEAAPPTAIKANLDKEINQINNKLDFFAKNIEILSNLGNSLTLKPKIYFFEGIEGIKETYKDTLNTNDTIYAIESITAMSPEVKDYVVKEYIPLRVKKQIPAFSILPNNPEEISFAKANKEQLRETKLITDPEFNFDFELNIYGNKASLIVFKENNYSSFIIENQVIADSLKSLYKIIWKNLP